MEIRKEGKSSYELLIGDSDIQQLFVAEAPPLVSPYAQDGCCLWLFPNPSLFSGNFSLMPDGDGYYAYVGAITIRKPEDLKRLIAFRGKLPIEIPNVVDRRKIRLGYVRFQLEGQ